MLVLNDDGCNTNVLSKDFVERHRSLFKTHNVTSTIHHSDKHHVDHSNEIVLNAEIEIGGHRYSSNCVVADCRYDVLLGMPWHEETNPKMNYKTRELKVGDVTLSISKHMTPSVIIQNLGVKKFRSLLRKRKRNTEDFTVYQVRCTDNMNVELMNTSTADDDPDIAKIREEFSSVFRSDLPEGLPPEREIDHKIEVETGSTPPHLGMFQLSPAELIATKEYITDLLKKKKIRPSKSPYGAPLFFVKQKGSLRAVIDYRALNRITKHNNAPIPRTDEMFDRLGQARYYSKLDLKTGFHQIRIAPADVEKTAFKTKYGHFEFLVMPMGLRNAPATFQTLMNAIFRAHIDEFIVIYLDDILVFSDSKEEYLRHLRIVLSRLQENELYVGKNKYTLGKTETEFLGLIVGRDGMKIGEGRKRLIKDWPVPTSITEVRSFLGLAQFFRRFIKHYSQIAAPMTNITRKNGSINNWDKDCNESFTILKHALVTAPIMRAPDWSRPFRCHTDASQLAVGGTLSQLDNEGNERVLSYFSKRLSPAEENYSANDRELLDWYIF